MDYLRYGSKGPRVKVLQELLNKNPYFKPRRALVLDGEMGPLTCSAVMRAKYFLGYTQANVEPVAGNLLIGILSGKIQLTADQMARRVARLKKKEDEQSSQSSQTKMRLKALGIIKGELGTLEQPNNSNHIIYNTWWGWGPQPYCVIGISWAWVRAGSTAFARGKRWAGTDVMLADAKAERNGLHLTNDPDPGCPGVIDFDGHTDPDHAITLVKDNGNGTCETVEFNTSKNGTYIQGVWNKTRPNKNCWFFEVEH
jgi:peptidoglycan hydrolase-like protein with peptidoglycan-binding domain